jgi:hypothetical protein
MIYNKPIKENNSIASLFAMILKPKGPMITPEIINPIIPGILNLRRSTGDNKMMNKITEKTKIKLLKGNLNSLIKWSKNSSIVYFEVKFNYN